MSMLAEEVVSFQGVVSRDVPIENVAKDEPGSNVIPSSTVIELLTWAFGDYRGRVADGDKALTYSAVWACNRIISNALSMVGWHVYELEVDGKKKGKRQVEQDERTAAGDVAFFLGKTPNGEQTSFDWRQAVISDAVLRGNGYSFIDRDPFGRIRQLWRLAPNRVTPKRLGGNLVYIVNNGEGVDPDVLTPDQVLHFKGPSPDGLVGYSVIEMARRTIELGVSQEEFGRRFFQRGPMPGGVLKLPQGVKQEDKDQMREGFQRLYGGAENAGRVVVLTGGSDFTKLDLSNSDAQFLESRKFSIDEISRWFGVPPHMLASLDRATFSNIEHQRIEFVQDCLMPWAVRIEAEADVKLFGRVNRGRYWTKLNLAALLRGDTATQTSSLTSQVNGGLRTVNEAREQLDLNPIDGGDTPLVQGAMIPLERALEEPEPAPNLAPVAPPEEDDAEEPPSNLLAPLHRMFASTCGRLLRVEADKAKRANNRGNLDSWRNDFYGSPESAANEYDGDVKAALEAFGAGADKSLTIALSIAAEHNTYGYQAAIKDLADKDRPQQFAEECVKTVWRMRK